MTIKRTSRIFFAGALVCIIGASFACCRALADTARPADESTAPEGRCRDCHRCNFPTRDDPCLRPCSRPLEPAQPRDVIVDPGPNVVILDALARDYLPVPFDHRGHAAMAEMGEGCETCHHYTSEGRPHPPCKTCHDAETEGTDIRKPGLKGAYHQQCLNCHRDWTDEKNCDVCHHAKTGDGRTSALTAANRNEVLGAVHPRIPAPEGDLYQGRPDKEADTRVIFGHRTHVERFGLKCVECHRERSCARCHVADRASRRPLILVEHHRPCIACHKKDMDLLARDAGRCERCHWGKDAPHSAPFAHADTGWELRPYHQTLNCRQCHAMVPFATLDTDCASCHRHWPPENFDHRVTGQELDETHAEIACNSCHANKRFDEPPQCNECHDPEDGISFPDRRPGPRIDPLEPQHQLNGAVP